MLALWFMTFNPDAPPEEEEVMEVEEAVGAAANNGEQGNSSDQENNHVEDLEQNATAGNGGNADGAIIVLEETEDVEMKAPDVPTGSKERQKLPDLPNLPPPSPSISSVASSTASGATRSRRLPPPPPSMDWSYGSKSILGKRQGSVLGPDAKRMQMDEDMDSVCSVDESVPQQDKVNFDAFHLSIRMTCIYS